MYYLIMQHNLDGYLKDTPFWNRGCGTIRRYILPSCH